MDPDGAVMGNSDRGSQSGEFTGDSVIGVEVGDKDWAGRASGDGAHSRASSQRTSVMGQKYKLLLTLVPGHWAQVWGAVMGHGRGAITGTW